MNLDESETQMAAEVTDAGRAAHLLKVRKRTKTGCLSKWFFDTPEIWEITS